MRFNLERVRANVRDALTEDLLDRATVYREEMEPQALDLIERELLARGFTPTEIETHARRREEEGASLAAPRCSFCVRPAVVTRRGWHRLFGLLPVFPRVFRYCVEHRPSATEPPTSPPPPDDPHPPA